MSLVLREIGLQIINAIPYDEVRVLRRSNILNISITRKYQNLQTLKSLRETCRGFDFGVQFILERTDSDFMRSEMLRLLIANTRLIYRFGAVTTPYYLHFDYVVRIRNHDEAEYYYTHRVTFESKHGKQRKQNWFDKWSGISNSLREEETGYLMRRLYLRNFASMASLASVQTAPLANDYNAYSDYIETPEGEPVGITSDYTNIVQFAIPTIRLEIGRVDRITSHANLPYFRNNYMLAYIPPIKGFIAKENKPIPKDIITPKKHYHATKQWMKTCTIHKKQTYMRTPYKPKSHSKPYR